MPRPGGDRQFASLPRPSPVAPAKDSSWGSPLHTPLRPCSLRPRELDRSWGGPSRASSFPPDSEKEPGNMRLGQVCREQEFCKWRHLYGLPRKQVGDHPSHPQPFQSRWALHPHRVSTRCTAAFPSPAPWGAASGCPGRVVLGFGSERGGQASHLVWDRLNRGSWSGSVRVSGPGTDGCPRGGSRRQTPAGVPVWGGTSHHRSGDT